MPPGKQGRVRAAGALGAARAEAGAEAIRPLFEETVERVRKWDGPAVKPNDQLVLYGLYKQASFGDCRTQRPGLFDPTGRAKWTSWKSCEGLSETQAMQRYSKVAEAVCPGGEDDVGDAYAGLAGAGFAGTESNINGHDRPKTPPVRSDRHSNGNKVHGDATVDANRGPLSSTTPDPAAAGGAIERVGTERFRRHVGRDRESPMEQRQRQAEFSSPETSSSGRSVGGAAGEGDRFGAVGVAVAAAAVAVAFAVALGGSGRDQGVDEAPGERPEVGDGGGGFSGLTAAWPGATVIFMAFSALAVATGMLMVAAGCVWCAVRVARWREEIFAGSPIVAEALSRAEDLDDGGGSSDDRDSSSCAESQECARSGCSSLSNNNDPVGNIFRPGTRASRDFFAPPLMAANTPSTGADRSGANAAPTTEVATAATAEDEDGAVVFLTGVTGLVGQMVLFDLLRQGAAARRATFTDGGNEEGGAGEGLGSSEGDGTRKGVVVSRGLRRVVVLVRRKKGLSPSERVASIRDSPMFRPLRESGAWAGDGDGEDDGGDRGDFSATGAEDPAGAADFRVRRKNTGRGGAVVTAVEGELGKEGLGLTGESRTQLAAAGVTHALHCAASVSFSDPLAEAAATNITGALRVAALAASWPSCGTLVHVSTAFVHGGNPGTASSPLPQQLPDLGGRNPERLYRSAQTASSGSNSRSAGSGGDGGNARSTGGPGREAFDAIADLGYPNTYTFTKALGEHLLSRALRAHNRKLEKSAAEKDCDCDVDGGGIGAGNSTERETGLQKEADGRGVLGSRACSDAPCRLTLRIVRPSIVGPSWVFPWPGWTGEQPSTVTGCQVLVLQRAVKTFRLGPHPAPIIPVDVVSRAIVHSALGWGGPLTTAGTGGMEPIPRKPRDHSGADAEAAESSCPDFLIRNLAWATHPFAGDRGGGGVDPALGLAEGTAKGRNSQDIQRMKAFGDVDEGSGGGRMPSFREISGLLYDYAVLRGLRPSLEALAMRSSFAAASVLPAPPPVVHDDGAPSPFAHSPSSSSVSSVSSVGRDRPPLLLAPSGQADGERHPQEMGTPGGGVLGQKLSSRSVFEAMHVLLDRSPVWALKGLASAAEQLGLFGGGSGCGVGKRGGGAGADVTLKRLDKLAALPAVYEAFTWRQYFFDSALRVPGGLTPAGYALETALASELLQQSFPDGAAAGARASPGRRCAILRELSLQIQTHRSGGLRCGGGGGRNSATGGGVVREASTHGGSVELGAGSNGRDSDAANVSRSKERRGRRFGPLSLLCGRADRLVPWPALAWWAATLPGSAARGGVTVWVRLVAFAVRVVMSRTAAAVAVDVDSFRAAAPPGHRGAAVGGADMRNAGGAGEADETWLPRRAGAATASRRGDELKEDGAALCCGGAVSAGTGGEEVKDRVRAGREEGGGSLDGGCAGVVGASRRPWQCPGEAKGEGLQLAGGAAENVVVVLLPTHRSYLDFVLVSLFCASMRSLPGLSWLRVPKVAAADGPFGKAGTPLRWMMENLGAFFVRRGGKGEPHDALQRRLKALQEEIGDHKTWKPSQNRPREDVGTSSAAPDLNNQGSRVGAAPQCAVGRGENARSTDRTQNIQNGQGAGEIRDDQSLPVSAAAWEGSWPGPSESDPSQRGLETLEVFVEGMRSRDRRFLPPKTGLIRALQGAREGATLWLVPVSISYERVPEQARLAEELLSSSRNREGAQGRVLEHQEQQQQQQEKQKHVGAVGLTGLLRWTLKALSGRVRLGRVLMRAEDPVILRPGGDVRAALLEVRQRHRLGTVVTPYHIREAGEYFGLDEKDVRECVQELGGTVWEEDDDQTNPFALRPGWKLGNRTQAVTPPLPSGYASDLTSAARHISAAQPASNDTEAWMNHLQWLHLLEGGLRGRDTRGRRLTRWADWLLPPPPPPTSGTGFATAAAAEGTLEENGEEGEGEGSVVRGSVDDGADMGGDTTCGLGAYFREPDCASSPPGGSDAATAHETAESGETFPPPAESSSVASSSPSWVLAADASTGSSSSSSSSSSPLSFGMTSLLDDDGAGTTTATPAAAEAHESTNGAPSCSSPSPSFDETTASVEITSSANGDDNNGGAEATKVEQGSTQVPKDTQQCLLSAASQRVLAAILREFDLAEGAVAEARQTLLDKGFSQPSRGHVLQVLRNAREDKCQDQVEDSVEAREAGQLRMQGRGGSASSSSAFLASVALSVHGGGVCPLGAKSAPQNDLDSASTVATALLRGSGDDADEGGSWFGAVDGDKEAVGSWGFRDSGFCLESDRADGGDPYVLMRGNRYGICGRPLRGLLPFVQEAVAVPITVEGRPRRAVSPPRPRLPPSRLLEQKSPGSFDASGGAGSGVGSSADGVASTNAEGQGRGDGGEHVGGDEQGQTLLETMIEALGPEFDREEQVSFSRQERARHGAGHGLSDVWSLRTGQVRRAPDAVVWPASEDQVSRLMEWAGKEGVCLIPFGGGTSVTRALEVPPLEVEPRPVVSVDMRKMCRVLEVDVANGTAHIQAGVVGRKMAEELAERGVTMGHEPDSLEFSTLGGWVATRASGMKRGRYGNIEDMVLEVRVVTGRGLAWQHSDKADKNRPKAAGSFSRTSVGLDLAAAMLGSEGCLGIITSVVVKVVPLPDVSEHASFLFRDFKTGVAFCRELSRSSGRLGLASCRLLDNRQLRLGKAMKGDEENVASGLRATLRTLAPQMQSVYIRFWKGWDWHETSAVTMVFEGSRQETALQRREVSKIARFHGGLSGGASAGKSGYDLTFAIAYLRDFALLFDVLGESFETFVSWTALEGLCEKVRERVRREHRKRGLRGDAFVTHRVTQLYPEGACVYFYLAIYAQGVTNPTGVFCELEEAARDEILLAGGSLSHHHGIGKSRAGFLSRVSSPVVSALVIGMKRALDPNNVLAARNHQLAAESVLF